MKKNNTIENPILIPVLVVVLSIIGAIIISKFVPIKQTMTENLETEESCDISSELAIKIRDLENIKDLENDLQICESIKNYYKENLETERKKIYEGFEIKTITIEPEYIEGFEVWNNKLWINGDEKCNLIGIKIDENFVKKRWKIDSKYGDLEIANDESEPLEIEFICAKETSETSKEEPTCNCPNDMICQPIYHNSEIVRWQCIDSNVINT